MKISRTFLILSGILLLAFALRMFRLDFFSLRGDESFTVLFVQKPLAQMWQETLTVEPNPPLLYLALRGWIALAGDGEFATRFFSAFFGVLCVPLVYRLARDIFSARSVGLIAAFLMAINPYQIWHSQDVRNYTMWPALSLLALIFFWQWYSGASKRPQGAVLLFIVAELAALYTHYYEAFILLALNLFVFATMWRDRKKLVQWIVAQIVLAILYLPYPLILSNRVSAYGEGSGRQGIALWEIFRETFGAFSIGETLPEEWRVWLWIPLALIALAGLAHLFMRDWKRGLFFALYAGVPTLAVFALNMLRPLYLERYLNGIAPAYYLLIAYGIASLFQVSDFRFQSSRLTFRVLRILTCAALALVAFLALWNYWTNPVFAKAPDWRGLTDILNANAQPGDIIVQNFPEMSLLYYDRSKLPLVVYPETYLPDTKTTQQLNAMNANHQRVWFIPSSNEYWDPDSFVEKWLDVRGDLVQDWQVDDFRLRLYATPSQYLNTMQRVNLTYGDTLILLGFRTERIQDQTRIVLYWRAKESPKTNYNVRVELADLEGNLVAQAEDVPARGEFPTDQWRKNQIVVDQHEIAAPADAPVFRVRVCDAVKQTCLPITDPPTEDAHSYLRVQ